MTAKPCLTPGGSRVVQFSSNQDNKTSHSNRWFRVDGNICTDYANLHLQSLFFSKRLPAGRCSVQLSLSLFSEHREGAFADIGG